MFDLSLNNALEKCFILLSLFASLSVSTQVSAQAVHLSLCIDASGSIGQTGFDLQLEGTANAIRDVVPIDGSVELSVVIFGTVGTPLTFTETDNGNAATNTIVVNSLTDIEDVATEVENVTYPNPGQGTNTQDCINEAMILLGCGPVEGTGTCPDRQQIIDISTDGNPTLTSLSTTTCVNNGATQDPACQADAVAASNEARDRGVDAINVVGVGTGISVSNMQAWAFDAVTTPPPAPRPASSTIEVFDPAGIEDPIGSGTTAAPDEYTVGNPQLGDRGYVVLVGDFAEYEPTISAKIFNELNVVADIQVVKTANQVTVSPGGTLTYTLAVTNNSLTDDVPSVVVTDTLPPGVTFVSASGAGFSCNSPPATVVTCTIDPLPAAADIDITVVVTADP